MTTIRSFSGNFGRQRVKKRRLTAARSAGDHGVLVQKHRQAQKFLGLLRHAARLYERVEIECGLLEFAD